MRSIDDLEANKQTVLEHLEDLRKSLIIAVAAIILCSLVCFSFAEDLMNLVTLPLHNLNENLVVTGVTEAFFVKLKLAFMTGFIVSFPIVIWAIWRFFKPAFHPHERKYVYILFPIAIILSVTGVLFAYYCILPLVLNFFIIIAGANLDTMFKIDQYISFVLAFTIPFGVVFELPVFVFFLVKIGVVDHAMLARNRKYALLIIVIAAAALTPGPDPISQMMMAFPVYILFEISVLVARLAGRNRKESALVQSH